MKRNLLPQIGGIVAICLGITLAPTAAAGIVLADSVADWDAATNNGIDNFGNSVTAGSLLDAAEQGHAATSNGFWNYKGTNGPSGGTFSGSPGFLGWDDSSGIYRAGPTSINRTRMSTNSTQSGNEHSVREWFGDGLNGELLNISGSFTTAATSVPIGVNNNGVHVYVILNQFVLGEALLAPNEETYSFNFQNVGIIGDTIRIRFAVGPDGPIPANSSINDFFNDSVHFSGRIEQVTVPEPAGILILLSGLLALTRRCTSRAT